MKTNYAFFIKYLICFLVLGGLQTLSAQVLDLESTTEGALLPRMTTAQRTAITGASQSELIYDTDTGSFWYWENMQWNELGNSFDLPGTENIQGSNSPGIAIPDNDPTGITSTIALTGEGTIEAETEVRVCLNITHTFVADLDISLTAPDGTTIMDLTTDNGGGGDNFTNTCFSDMSTIAIESIISDDAPFTGLYRPETNYNALLGQNISGNWVLKIIDDAGGDGGTLDSWSIQIGSGDPLIANVLEDREGDTKIQVEESFDEDVIRFDVSGSELFSMSKGAGGFPVLENNNNFFNTIFGKNAGKNVTGDSNTLFGERAGENITSGAGNTMVGQDSGQELIDGSFNAALGKWSLESNTTGSKNVAIGVSSARNNLVGSFNTILGNSAGRNATGSYNVFIGNDAGTNEMGSNKLVIENSTSTTPLIYGEFDNDKLFFFGDVGIGNTTDNTTLATGFKLSVKGDIACEDILVEPEANWPDYVFEAEYTLKTLEEVKQHIDNKGHLPGVPSAKEVEENGIFLAEMSRIQMEKIEELTLYILQLEERIKSLEKKK